MLRNSFWHSFYTLNKQANTNKNNLYTQKKLVFYYSHPILFILYFLLFLIFCSLCYTELPTNVFGVSISHN